MEYVLNILTFLDTFFIYIHCIKHNKEEMARSRNSVRLTLEKVLRLGKGRNMYPIVVAAMRTKPRITDGLLRRRTRALLPQLTLWYMAGLSVLWHDNPHQAGIHYVAHKEELPCPGMNHGNHLQYPFCICRVFCKMLSLTSI